MSAGFLVKTYYYETGTCEALHSFFSTISFHLEKEGWGTEYPLIMDELYNGRILNKDVDDAYAELKLIKTRLRDMEPGKVIWDINDLSKVNPNGNPLNPDIDSLGTYFRCPDGRTYIELLKLALQEAKANNEDVQLFNI